MEERRCYGCMKLTDQDVCPHCGSPKDFDNDQNQLPVGTVLRDQYIVGKVLGHGGFGITYIGWDRYLDIVVAIKEFYPTHAVNRDSTQSLSVKVNTTDMAQRFEENRARFLREAKTLAKLRNIPQIVGVQSYFTENNTAYIIMDYVDGQDLRHYVQQRGGKVPAREILPILEPVVHALSAVHKEGLMHRDISPDNIMLLPSGEVILLDFGAAHDLEKSDADADLSHSTEAILKHGFAPMEQYRSRGNLGPWTDEYGFCASIYYCLTGEVPPDAPARAMDEVQPDWDSITGLTPNQRAALEKGMEMRAKDRFGSMEALHEALYKNVSVVKETPKPKKKKKWLIPMMILLLLAAGAGGAVWYWGLDTCTEVLMSVWPGTRPDTPEETIPVTEAIVAEPTTLPIETTPPTTAPPETTAPTEAPTPTEPDYSGEAWYRNLLMSKPLNKMGQSLQSINSVTFLDTLEGMPWNAVDVSMNQDGTVMAWGKWSNGYNVYIAAEDGINAQNACAGLFSGCANMQSVSFGDAFHSELATDMGSMFRSCERMTSVDVGVLNTAKSTSMEYMFYGCGSMKELNVGNWDVSNVTNMSCMFQNCSSVDTLDVSRWDVSNVGRTNSMFYGCTKLSSLSLRKWDVSKVKTMASMFGKCSSLTELDISRWDTSNVTDMSRMFLSSYRLQELDVSEWDVSQVTDMSYMFQYCSSLRNLNVSNWNVSRVTNMRYMFFDASFDASQVASWDVSRVTTYDSFMNNGTLIGDIYWTFFFEGV